MYNNDEGDAVVINANYAIDAGLNPTKDPIAVESGENNPYANIITVQGRREQNRRLWRWSRYCTPNRFRTFIREKYRGA